MRLQPGVVARLRVTCGLLLLVAPFEGAAQQKSKKYPIPAPAPRVSSALRAASLRKVADYLETSRGTLEQPAVLVPLFERLYQLGSGQNPEPVHILHFGDSHTAGDEWTGGIRNLFKGGFGDGGSGFSIAGHHSGYRRFDVYGGGTSGWHTDGLRSATGDGYFGLGGISISTQQAGQSVFIETECDVLEIHYLQQPGGGDLSLYDYDQHLKDFSTAGDLQPGFVRYQISGGPHRFALKTLNSRPVRLFGWVADRRAGVTYEALGINGAEAAVILRWDERMLTTYLERRDPGLIVLAYGTNEAAELKSNFEGYQAMFSNLLRQIRRASPAASILVIGPPDGYLKYHGKWRLLAEVDGIIAAQQNACRENGCAFWDTREHMGGTSSMRDWVLAGFAQGDYIHFTPTGYRRLAEALFADIMQYYETYKRIRREISEPVSHGQANQDR